MKKTLVALCALLAGTAMAQSSVTVFGILDVAARDLKGADSVKYLSNEGRSASRLGFRGVEDMGGGLKASFHIEHGFNPDSGTTDANFWQRRATVSLTGEFGEIRLGRHKTATRTLQDDFDIFGTSGMPGLNRIMGLDRNRIENQVAYFFPKMGSFYGNVEVSAGEGAQGGTGSGAGKSMAGRFGYRDGGLNVSGAFRQLRRGQPEVEDHRLRWQLRDGRLHRAWPVQPVQAGRCNAQGGERGCSHEAGRGSRPGHLWSRRWHPQQQG